MTEIAGVTIGSILFIVIVVSVAVLVILALLTPVFVYLINLRIKELVEEQTASNFHIIEESHKFNERIEELQKTNFLILSELKKINNKN